LDQKILLQLTPKILILIDDILQSYLVRIKNTFWSQILNVIDTST
jgi:hypothetical protein